MDYKKKLKQRLYIAIIYIALGIMMIVGTSVIKTDNDFIRYRFIGDLLQDAETGAKKRTLLSS